MEKQLISGTSLACKNICLKKFSKEDLQDHLEYLKRKNKYSDKDWLYNLRGIIERLIGKQCDAYHQVEEIIRCAIDKGQNKLTIADYNLYFFPSCLDEFVNLQKLRLVELDIHTVPSCVKGLIRLTELTVSKCPVGAIPKFIGDLKNLHSLDFSRCRISEIPKEICFCDKLDSVRLDYNHLTDLPEEFLRLPHVQELVLDCNPLALSWKRDYLPSLNLLSLSETRERSVPSYVIKKLFQLVWSHIDRGLIDCIPTDLGERLVHLDLAGNGIRDFPSGIKNLANLEYLNISGNQIRLIPSSFLKKTKIRNLFLQQQ